MLSLFLGKYLCFVLAVGIMLIYDTCSRAINHSFGFITHSNWDRLLGPKKESRGNTDKELE
jgi:hypothetical protein